MTFRIWCKNVEKFVLFVLSLFNKSTYLSEIYVDNLGSDVQFVGRTAQSLLCRMFLINGRVDK